MLHCQCQGKCHWGQKTSITTATKLQPFSQVNPLLKNGVYTPSEAQGHLLSDFPAVLHVWVQVDPFKFELTSQTIHSVKLSWSMA
jgi:hypothetical protein